MIRFITLVLTPFILTVSHAVQAGSLPKVTQASIDDMGVTSGIPQMSGFVFVDGQYLPPPYTVVRRGNAIFVNRSQIEQPVAWTYFDRSASAGSGALDQDGDITQLDDKGVDVAAVTVPAKVSSIDDLFSDEDTDVVVKEEDSKTISSIDDLFGDDDDEDDKKLVVKQPVTVNSIDDLFGDDDDDFGDMDNLKPAVVVKRRVIAPRPSLVPQTAEQLAAKKVILKKRLDDKRATYERAIAKGELFFFGTSHNRINGTYGTARAMLEVLPSALRYSRSPSDLLLRLKAGNVYFVDHTVCDALYKYKTTFPLLQQRLDKIRQMEDMKAAKRKKQTIN